MKNSQWHIICKDSQECHYVKNIFLSEGFEVWLWKNTHRVTVRQTPSKFTVMLLRYKLLSELKIVESPYPNPTQVSLAYAFNKNENKVF